MLLPSVPVVGVRVDESMPEAPVRLFTFAPLSDIEPLFGMLPLFRVAVLLPAAGMVEPGIGADGLVFGLVSLGIVVAPEVVARCPESEVWASAKLTTPTSAETLATAMRIWEVFIGKFLQ